MRRQMVIGMQNHETVSGVHPEVLEGGGGKRGFYKFCSKKLKKKNEEKKGNRDGESGDSNRGAPRSFGGGGGNRVFIQCDLKNCNNKYNSNTVYNCIYVHTNISMFHDSPN